MNASILALAFLALTSALRADEKRVFENNSDAPWTLSLVARSQKEVANMNFFLNGKETVLGANGTADSIVLPPNSRFIVEFTHTSRAFYHAFRITDAKGGSASFTADYPWPTATPWRNRPPVELTFNGSTLAGKDLASLKPWFTVNEPMKGDLTIYREQLGAVPREQALVVKVVNTTGRMWILDPVGGGPTITATVPGLTGIDFDVAGGLKLRPNATAKLEFAPTKHARTLKISNSVLGAWVLKISNDPSRPYPDAFSVQVLSGDTRNPWVRTNEFLSHQKVEIGDPDEEATFTVVEAKPK